MNMLRTLSAAAQADIRERTRGQAFWVALALVAWLAYAVASGRILLRFENYQGTLNSAWLGSVIAMIVTALLGWFGFFLINNSLDLDRRTGAGEIIAATRISSLQYVIAKWLSNFTLLALLVLLLMVATVFLQWRHMHQAPINLVALLAPIGFVALPLLALVAAFAVLFESVKTLRGGFGNVVWLLGFSFMVMTSEKLAAGRQAALDPFGLRLLGEAMRDAVKAQFPAYGGGMSLTFISHGSPQFFRWSGIDWTGEILFARLLWFVVAAAIVLLASKFFDRFDPGAASGSHTTHETPSSGAAHAKPWIADANATKLPVAVSAFAPFYRFLVEVRLMAKSVSRSWYAVAIALAVGGFFASSPGARGGLLLAAWIWPVLIWSAMGSRELCGGTSQFVFSSKHSLWLQLPMQWLAGVIVAMLTGSGVLLSMVMAGNLAELTTWIAAAMFIPSLALVLGVTTGTRKAFEVVYIVLCYVGPMNGVRALDFIGMQSPPNAIVWLALTATFMCAALLGCWRRMNH